MKVLFWLFWAGLLSSSAQAEDKIVLIGGAGSSSKIMRTCEGQERFLNIGYDEAVDKIPDLIQEMNSHPEQKYIVAAHSSGTEFFGRFMKKVKNLSQLTLVNLDGFDSSEYKGKAKMICWWATNAQGLRSRNAKSMSKANCGISKVYMARHCQTAWCLHFSLVNMRAPSYLEGATVRKEGYKNCVANLDWAKDLGSDE